MTTINDDAVIVVYHKFVKQLSGHKLLAYSLIYSMCVNTESGQYYASTSYLAERLGTTRNRATTILKELVEEGYLCKSECTTPSGTFIYTLPVKENKVSNITPTVADASTEIDIDTYNVPVKPLETNSATSEIKLTTRSPKKIFAYITDSDYDQCLKDAVTSWYNTVILSKKNMIPLSTIVDKITNSLNAGLSQYQLSEAIKICTSRQWYTWDYAFKDVKNLIPTMTADEFEIQQQARLKSLDDEESLLFI